MERINVSEAREYLENLLHALTNAYWDANKIDHKDILFEVVTIINTELNEISKLSVNDYSMGYEPITADFPGVSRKFKQLQQSADDWFPRTKTADELHRCLSRAAGLISTKAL